MKSKTIYSRLKTLLAFVLVGMLVLSCSISTGALDDEPNSQLPEVSQEEILDLLDSLRLKTDSGSTSVDEICEINNVEDLRKFVQSVNDGGADYSDKTVNLNSNIYWSGDWYTIKNFNGTFNGNNNTISGLNNGFINFVGENGKVEKLNIKAEINCEGNIGGIVGYNTGTVSECSFSGVINSDDAQTTISFSACGGIVGVNLGRIDSCTTTSDTKITRQGVYGGGIVGFSILLEDDAYHEPAYGIFNCDNYAQVTCSSMISKAFEGACAGIVGYSLVKVSEAQDLIDSTAYISNCTNYGSIYSDGALTGGIAGAAKNTKILSCKNYADVIQNNSLWVGGIVGSFNQGSYFKDYDESQEDEILNIIDCENHGDITGYTRVGGIVGGEEKFSGYVPIVAYNYSQSLISIKECINTGKITTNGYGGGISGYCCANISRCYNTGEIFLDLSQSGTEADGWNAIGGIASRGYRTIADCVNIGDINVLVNEPLVYTAIAGGIIGNQQQTQIVRCYNSAPISGNYKSSTSDTDNTVYYGGITGVGSIKSISDTTFNNSFDDEAQRAVANFFGEGTDNGLSIAQMSGSDLDEKMSALIESGNYELSENLVIGDVTYQLTPTLTGMPTLYDIDPETTLKNAAMVVEQADDSSSEEDTTDENKEESSNSTKSPKTGDFNVLFMLILSSAVIALIISVFKIKSIFRR